MYIRLTKKLANALNGLDLRSFRVGDVLHLQDPLAEMLIAERWAEQTVREPAATADDRPMRPGKGSAASAGRTRRTLK